MPRIDILLAQLLIIVLSARVLGALFRRIHQPQVLGEIVAGILLGPSLFGWLAPSAAAWLFPAGNMGALYALSQLGLVLFMFHVGLETDPSAIRKYGRTAIMVSNTSMVIPFALGVGLALWIVPSLATGTGSRFGFALFTGVAMSITAFPVLARILAEGDLLATRIGMLAIACAAVDDVSAWCVLAVIVAIVRSGSGGSLVLSFIGLAVYMFAMVWVVRRLASKWFRSETRSPAATLAGALLLLLASSFATESVGVHALFGAFMAGLVMPREENFRLRLSTSIVPLSTTLLLPVFFAYTGLRTSFGLVRGGKMWLYLAAVLAVAIVGKLAGSMMAARINGLPWRESAALGVLLNTRGLIELVILNVGYDLGVISKEMFTLMVIMALTTTFMTAPLLSWIYPKPKPVNDAAVAE
jgi:Kef-type K+ transport system membrane component KefB